MDFQFIIPHTNSELLNTNGNNYFVKKVYDASDLPELFKGSLNIDACYEIYIEFCILQIYRSFSSDLNTFIL